MSRTLILYGTTEGHTERVSHVMASALIDAGLKADVVRAGTYDPDMAAYDGVIVAASIHVGGFQKPVVECVQAHAREIAARPNAFVVVCLGILQKDDPKVAADLKQIVDRFAAQSGWTPAFTKFVAGALPYTKYNFVTRWLMKRIVSKAGGDTDTTRDYVYTDWDDVRKFAVEFSSRLKPAAA